MILSSEQLEFINLAKEGKNVLVDACIGSGKTTAIQSLCDKLPKTMKILYLTYNMLLKVDARNKIRNRNVTVTNYHGFAFMTLAKMGIRTGVSELIQTFNSKKPKIDDYDLLVIDEYQDIEQELADMLNHIKNSCPNIQIVAVGDMEQKIYDKTTLNVPDFIDGFLGDYTKMQFTQCFRLSEDLAKKLGRIWEKDIQGVNNRCTVESMSRDRVIQLLAEADTKDILCLGARTGEMSKTLNILERRYPEKFNKETVYASISDKDRGAVTPTDNTAIFTTFDSSKGLERNICVIFDFTENYWELRINKPMVSYDILRNIFCVASSRGKERIIFVTTGEAFLSERTLTTRRKSRKNFVMPFDMSEMFAFKYKEDVEHCFSLLKTKKINTGNNEVISIKNTDCLIDLSPCIGKYQEAVFFENYDMESELKFRKEMHRDRIMKGKLKDTLDKHILNLTAFDTRQERYNNQVKTPFVSEEQSELIKERLRTVFTGKEEVQNPCEFSFLDDYGNRIYAKGRADVVKDDTVYELKFVSELNHDHFLQCACYIVALNLEKGILWNTRNNDMYEITVPDKKKFLDAVVNTITKGVVTEYTIA